MSKWMLWVGREMRPAARCRGPLLAALIRAGMVAVTGGGCSKSDEGEQEPATEEREELAPEEACERSDANACHQIEQDEAEADRLLRLACEGGYSDACAP